jgi:hypothetical protein
MTAKKVRFSGILQNEDPFYTEDTLYDTNIEEDEDYDFMKACLITIGIIVLVALILVIAFLAIREIGG